MYEVEYDEDRPAGTLDEWLDEKPPTTDVIFVDDDAGEPGDQRWKIRTTAGASWVLRKLRSRRNKIKANAETARAEIDRVNAWLDHVNRPLGNDVDYFTGLLHEWYAEETFRELGVDVLADAPDPEVWAKFRHKTIELPGGKLAGRSGTGSTTIGDSDAAVRFASAFDRADLYVIPKPKVTVESLAKAVKAHPDTTEFDGRWYWIRVAVDVIEDHERAKQLDGALADLDGFMRTIIDTFDDVAINAAKYAEDNPRLRVTQQLGEHPQLETWLRVPTVACVGKGRVSVTVKIDEPDPVDEMIDDALDESGEGA